MADEQRGDLVRSYLDGAIGRRVFVKGLLASGITLAGAVAYADVLAPRTARAAAAARRSTDAAGRDGRETLSGFYNFYVGVGDNQFQPQNVTVTLRGDSVSWGMFGPHDHSVTDTSGLSSFDSGYAPPTRIEYTMVFPAAGSFPYHCKDAHHSGTMTGTVHVKVGRNPAYGPLGTTFTIKWAQKPADSGFVFDVQMKHGTGAFKDFRTGVTGFQAAFKPTGKGQYFFRGRVRNPTTGAASGYSPPSSISVT
jgi:plastocyanin